MFGFVGFRCLEVSLMILSSMLFGWSMSDWMRNRCSRCKLFTKWSLMGHFVTLVKVKLAANSSLAQIFGSPAIIPCSLKPILKYLVIFLQRRTIVGTVNVWLITINNWEKIFKSGLSKFCGRQPLKSLLSPLLNTLSQFYFRQLDFHVIAIYTWHVKSVRGQNAIHNYLKQLRSFCLSICV